MMSIFKNEVLAEIDKMVPTQMGKVKQVMLFTLIDHYIDGKCTDQEFVSALKPMLGVEE
jgi:hypothetical protein